MEQVFLQTQDGYKLNVHIFEAKDAKGYVQVIHGMEEHQERYEGFVANLNSNGYTVVTSNMRGHGEDAPELGFFAEKKAHEVLLADQKLITKYIKERYNAEKIIVFAHSMGTIITRNLMMTETKDYEKVVLSGFPNIVKVSCIAAFMCSVSELFHGPHYFSKTLEGVAVGSFNKCVKNPRTGFDWLSYNEENVDKYIADPYCGHGFKVSSLKALFTLVGKMSFAKNYSDVTDIPLLLVSGADDPCTGGEKGRLSSIETLNQAGFSQITEIHYDGMRHEMLNEKEHLKVEQDVINFLSE